MKVILISDEGPFGKKGEIRDVKSGFARNFLIPRKIAVEANPGNLKTWEQQISVSKKREVKLREEAKTLASRLEGVVCTIPMKVGDEERIFGSVTTQTISDALSQQGFDISKKDIDLGSPIKTLGTHDVRLKLYSDVSVMIKVEVTKKDQESV
ncbi:MAG: 50S ribosomal protein L9 [Deltaproteobacteria bacterium]|nr:50S ribosomal protein L9 [Deltaproteobacteria bacterium]